MQHSKFFFNLNFKSNRIKTILIKTLELKIFDLIRFS